MLIALIDLNLSRAAAAHDGPAETQVDFHRDVRPVLSDNCFFCHGPDKQESDLRLDDAATAYQKGAIVPGDSAASEMIRRITSSDPDYRMPPPDANRELTPRAIESLRTWIDQGAVYRKHWALQPVPEIKSPALVEDQQVAKHPIDRYVLQRLQEAQLAPSPPARRERLLRRVTLDLTGLPPTIAEIDSFLADESIDAWEKIVDRLLASPAFGEQMTQQWIDVARYADTHGYDNDNENHLWPWRDWVIRAFNDNLPYSDFIRWQLAGDLLPEPTQDQLVATAFNRLHRQNAEGGVLPEEFVVEYVVDRTQTFGTAFLGMTIECARCHDHKFDPISQRDFYGLYALFGNIDELGTYAEGTSATPTPNTFLYTDGQKQQHAELKRRIAECEAALEKHQLEATGRFESWRATADAAEHSTPDPAVHLPFESRDKLPESARLVDGPIGHGVRFAGDEGAKLEDVGGMERTDEFTVAAWLRPTEVGARMVIWHNSKPVWTSGHRGMELAIDPIGRVELSLCHFWPGNAIRVKTRKSLTPKAWTHTAVTYDGSSRAEGVTIYLDGAAAPLEIVRDNLYNTTQFDGDNRPPLEIGARKSELGFRQGEVDEFRLYETCLTRLELQRIAKQQSESIDDHDLQTYFVERIDENCAIARQKLTAARQAENDFVGGLRSIMVMREKPAPARAHLLIRGAYDQLGEEVAAGVPMAILDPGPVPPRNRLELVEWMLRRDHPLVSRVAVNRIWKIFFGQGLVETIEDFGSQGSLPTHPDLLDHLAARLMDGGWDVKALCRLIVTSATYCQSSQPRPDLAERDPQNLLLARGPRHRLSAEQIRDAALKASGLLVEKIGGPSVKPTQPPGLWQEVGPQEFEADVGEKQYRRSLYTFWKRTVPPPNMMAFDAVSREVCVPRRETTVTPAQALVLLNDPQFVEAARALAADVMINHAEAAGSLEEAFRRLTGRKPRSAEKQDLLLALAQQREVYAENPEAAKQYLAVGALPRDESLDPVDLASMTAVVQVLMGLFEFQVKS